MNKLSPVELLVCVKCRRDTAALKDGTRPGAMLHAQLVKKGMPDGVTLKAVECLSNCSSGCSIALRGGSARWTYVYGNLIEGRHVEIIIDGVTAYFETENGLVPWRARSEHFRKNCVARIPPQEF